MRDEAGKRQFKRLRKDKKRLQALEDALMWKDVVAEVGSKLIADEECATFWNSDVLAWMESPRGYYVQEGDTAVGNLAWAPWESLIKLTPADDQWQQHPSLVQ